MVSGEEAGWRVPIPRVDLLYNVPIMDWLRRFFGGLGTQRSSRAVDPTVVAKMQTLIRPCWTPIVQDGEGGATASRFGGCPALALDEAWPKCGACKSDLRLFCQIDIANAPRSLHVSDLPRAGLLQLFYCTAKGCTEREFGFYASNTLARILPPETCLKRCEGPAFPAKQVVQWRRHEDLPHAEESLVDSLGTSLDDLEDLYETSLREGRESPVPGDKWLGWPAWIQSPCYPCCLECERPMQFLLQIASECNVPFMFGDAGHGYLMVCPAHLGRVAFFWDCC